MASVNYATTNGAASVMAPFRAGGSSYATASGVGSATVRVAWGGNSKGPTRVSDWLPRIDHKLINPRTGLCDGKWHNYFREVGERLGGIRGDSVESMLQQLQQTQAMLLSTMTIMQETIAYARSVNAVAQAAVSAAIESGTLDPSTVPDTTEPPNFDRYNDRYGRQDIP